MAGNDLYTRRVYGSAFTAVDPNSAAGGGVFRAVFGQSELADIRDCFESGKAVECIKDGCVYSLSELDDDGAVFVCAVGENIKTLTCGADGWSALSDSVLGVTDYNDLENKPSIPVIDADLETEGAAADAKAAGDAISLINNGLGNCIRRFFTTGMTGSVPDCDNGTIRNLKIYGKTTQDGTATPSSPVALHSVEEIKVRVTKKNMLPSPTFSGSTYGVVWEYGIPCKANETVTFSFKVDSVPVNDKRGQLVASTDSHIENRFNPVTGEINMTTIQIAAGTNTATLTPQADGYIYFRIVERSSSWSLYDMQLERGETATAYEAYSEQARTITPPAPLHGLGTYRDVCDVDGGVWKYNIGSRLVSNQTWLERSSETDYYTQYGISGFLKKGNTPAISTCFGTGASWGGNNANKVGIGNGDQSYCFIGKSTFPSLADCNSFMQAHDVYVYSALETPTETAIDSADLEFLRSLSTAYPQTNVFITDQDNRSIDSDFLYPMSIKTALESMRKDIDRLLTLIVNT